MKRQQWTCILASMAGGIASGAMGLSWLAQPPSGASWAFTSDATAYLLLATLVAACVGGLLVLQSRTRWAVVVLCSAGVVPGVLEPRAFVATFLLVFAGLLASSLPRGPRSAVSLRNGRVGRNPARTSDPGH